MTRKIFYGSFLLLLVHHLSLGLFVAIHIEGSRLSEPSSIRHRTRTPQINDQERNRNSEPPQQNQFVLFKLANHTQRTTINKFNGRSMKSVSDGSLNDSSNASVTTSKDEPTNIVSSAPKSRYSGEEVKVVSDASLHEMVEFLPLFIEAKNESQPSNVNETNLNSSVGLSVHPVECDGMMRQNENEEHNIVTKLRAITNTFSGGKVKPSTHESTLILSENSETTSREFIPLSCDAIFDFGGKEMMRKVPLSSKNFQANNSNSNFTEAQKNNEHNALGRPQPPAKDDVLKRHSEMPTWTCLPPEPRATSKSFKTLDLCCCDSIDVFWSAYNAERAELKNHTALWDDLCTYYNATKTVVCSGSQVIEVPTLKTLIDEVNTLIFDNTNIESLEEQAATEKLPKSRGLGFTNGALFNISPEFLSQIRTNELTLSNNSLSEWNFSWFASESPSNITSINLALNLIQFLPKPKVGPDFVLPHLHTLDLSHNPLLVIPPDLFRPLTHSPVKCLGLRNCSLEDFGIDCENSIVSSLQFLLGLEALDLSLNPRLSSYKVARFMSPLRGGRLQTLILSGNGYFRVPYSALETVSSSLKELDLHSSSLSCLDNSSFPYLPELRSLNLDFSRISTLLPGVFDSTPNLESLSLQGNHFVSIPSAVRLPSLKELSFRGNPRIEDEYEDCAFSLEKDSFKGMTGLEDLNLAETPIQHLDARQFHYMQSLRTLTLSRCLIRSIQPRAFAMLENLQSLYLNSNRLELLDNNSFAGLPNLTVLNLDDNEITLTRPYPSPLSPVDGRDLHGRKKSTERHVYGDSRTQLFQPKSKTTHPKSEMSFSTSNRPFAMLKKLQVLSLASNRIGELIPVFDDLESLSVLDLSRNVVFDWTERVFTFNPSLSWLNLYDNRLSSFTDAMIQDFTNENLTEINIGLNPFSCTCSLYDALEEVNSENFIHYEEYTCTVEGTFPEQYEFFSDDHDECSLESPEDVAGSSRKIIFLAIVLTVLVTAGIAATLVVRRKLPKRKESTDAERHTIEMMIPHQYDVFICYAAPDKSWVFNALMPVFENTFRLLVCVHERDFEPGDMIVENISSSITRSRKVLFVMSPASVSSRWCRLELDFTRASSVNAGTNKLIVLQKEAVPCEDQPQVLRSILNTRTYIEWADDAQVQALAWAKLRRVLTRPNLATKPGS